MLNLRPPSLNRLSILFCEGDQRLVAFEAAMQRLFALITLDCKAVLEFECGDQTATSGKHFLVSAIGNKHGAYLYFRKRNIS